MRGTGLWLIISLSVLACGCCPTPPCVEGDTDGVTAGSVDISQAPYRSTGDPYAAGPLAVRTISLDRCQAGAPLPLVIYAPEVAGTYPVVVFQHGFLSRNIEYSEILSHLAGHGFVVVAPQMYEPGLAVLLGNPTAAEEAVWAADVVDWVRTGLAAVVGGSVRTDLLGLAGHSRGGKVVWLEMLAAPARATAFAGVDPVDDTGGPLGNQPHAIQGPLPFSLPALIIGTGMGGSCAPEGENHVKYYDACQSPAWHVVAPDYGHGDMLDEDYAAAAALICPSGSNRSAMRQLTGGLLVAFFRASLQGDEQAYNYLTDAAAAPVRVEIESK